jgi:hypothetical protein
LEHPFLFATACSLVAIHRVPLYGEAKAILLAWLVLPHFKGATWVYETIIGPGSTKLRAELQKIPALERFLNQEDAAPAKVDLIPLRASLRCGALWPSSIVVPGSALTSCQVASGVCHTRHAHMDVALANSANVDT